MLHSQNFQVYLPSYFYLSKSRSFSNHVERSKSHWAMWLVMQVKKFLTITMWKWHVMPTYSYCLFLDAVKFKTALVCFLPVLVLICSYMKQSFPRFAKLFSIRLFFSHYGLLLCFIIWYLHIKNILSFHKFPLFLFFFLLVVQEIDGKAFLLLKSEMMLKYMGLKLGPVVKICSIIDKIKAKGYKWSHINTAWVPSATWGFHVPFRLYPSHCSWLVFFFQVQAAIKSIMRWCNKKCWLYAL